MYEEKKSQKERLLKVLQEGKKVCQIDLNYYLKLIKCKEEGEWWSYIEKKYVDAIADLGIANLPARIFGLKKDGYDIKSKNIECQGRFCKTHYYVYYLEK